LETAFDELGNVRATPERYLRSQVPLPGQAEEPQGSLSK
jgi:hypothetical protein